MEDLFESIVGAMWFDNDLVITAIEEYVLKKLNLNGLLSNSPLTRK